MPDRFDKFTERARRVLAFAQEEAQRFNHNYIGTEHLLLALAREEDGVAAKVLANLGVELDRVRSAVGFIIGRGERSVVGEIRLTPRAEKAIDLAINEARRLQHTYIGTEHLLLGLVREGEGIAAGVLESLGVNLERVRTETMRILSQAMPQGQAPGARAPAGRQEATMADRFDRFTDPARRVLTHAQEEAQRHNHNYIGTEHMLLGLLSVDGGVAVRLLTDLGLDPGELRSAVESAIRRGDHPPTGEIGLTPGAKKVIELAAGEERRLNYGAIGTKHLLIALVAEGEGIAARVLTSRGVSLERVREEVAQKVRPGSGMEDQDPAAGAWQAVSRPVISRRASPEFGAGFALGMALSPPARQALEQAWAAAQRRNHRHIGPEHLLLALTGEDTAIAAGLQRRGVDLAALRVAIESLLIDND